SPKTVNYGFVLRPLYMYPSPGAWDPLFNAARVNPTLTFQAVINPNNGPDGGCPGPNYIHATSILSSITNIKTLAYVHTAARYNCGVSGTDICPATQLLGALQANMTTC
ncbi:hypothetical protein LTR16_009012, partial [Cryomyces antarcticus]